MKAHFVTFYSPGTLMAETTEKPITSWDTTLACEMAAQIKERYGACPYGFCFTTRSREEQELDSKVTATSPFYFLGGKVETIEEVKARATEADHTLISNMECNGYARIITNNNSWQWTQPLSETDIVLPWKAADNPTSGVSL